MNKPLNVTGNIGVTGTVDGVDIQTLNTTAGAALPKAGGTMTGTLSVNTGGSDANSVSNLSGDFSTWIRVGDMVGGSGQTQTNGYGIKFADAGVIHWSVGGQGSNFKISKTNTLGDELFPSGSRDDITITSAGQVGIGAPNTSVFNGVGGNSKLVVKGSDSSTNILNNSNASITIANDNGTANNTSALHFARADTDDNPHYAGASIVAQFVETQVTGQYPKGQLSFLTSTASNTAPSEKMLIDSSGDVGIGVSPYADCKVTIGGTVASYSSVLMFDNNTAGGAEFFMLASDDTWSAGAGNFYMGHGAPGSGNVDMTKNSTGNVGIGEASPGQKLQVNGNIRADGQVSSSLILENSSSGTAGLQITGAAGASHLDFMYAGGPGTGTNL